MNVGVTLQKTINIKTKIQHNRKASPHKRKRIKTMLPIIHPIKKILILATCIGLTACFHNEPDVTPNQAFSNALTQISNVSNKTDVIISNQTDNSTAYESLGGASAAFTVLNDFFGGNFANSFDGNLFGSSMSGEISGEMNDSNNSPILYKPSNNTNTNTIQHKLFDLIKQHTSTIDKSNARQKNQQPFQPYSRTR